MKYFLNDNVIGPFSEKLFAKKGDEVELISEHGNVCIVEKDGVRFTAATSKLSTAEINEEPGSPVPKAEEQDYRGTRQKKKAKFVTQSIEQSLF